jgi:hypothetical protein
MLIRLTTYCNACSELRTLKHGWVGASPSTTVIGCDGKGGQVSVAGSTIQLFGRFVYAVEWYAGRALKFRLRYSPYESCSFVSYRYLIYFVTYPENVSSGPVTTMGIPMNLTSFKETATMTKRNSRTTECTMNPSV